MGRPKKNIDEKRDIQIVVKLNRDEYLQLKGLMEYAEKNASEVVREIVFKQRLLKPRTPLLDAQTYTQLRRVGNNLNQYVKAVHQTRISHIDRQILIELQETLEAVGKKILKI
jgi:hypothetical protein